MHTPGPHLTHSTARAQVVGSAKHTQDLVSTTRTPVSLSSRRGRRHGKPAPECRWARPQGTIITQMLMDGGSTERHGATGGHSVPQVSTVPKRCAGPSSASTSLLRSRMAPPEGSPPISMTVPWTGYLGALSLLGCRICRETGGRPAPSCGDLDRADLGTTAK